MPLLPRNKYLALVLALAVLSGCADYMTRRDPVTLGAGNAPEGNTAVHTVNPFPPKASNPVIDG
ncbi:MAG: hypothetical protein H5U16_03100 [Roseovarius sp.]|nr:hypothetical protein [Roseovarius sp.]